MPSKIDLNADLGESYGIYSLGDDERLLNYVSSANIACGLHAGDPNVMQKTVKLAIEKKVAIGAHPGLPDLQGFGRRMMQVNPEEVYAFVLYQLGALEAFLRAESIKLHHVKPHGALYNMAAQQPAIAQAIAKAVFDFDKSLILYGLSGSYLISEGQKIGLKTASEVFADRTYQSDGSLTPRSQAHALIEDTEQALAQVFTMIEGCVNTRQGAIIPIQADTICLHGDGAKAVEFASTIHTALIKKGIIIQSP
jgi:5-oxoprolinase (ATP-hydrolysing) subunit A